MRRVILFSAAFCAATSLPAAAAVQANPDPELVRELAAEVQQIQAQLPMAQGPVTIESVALRGTEIIYGKRVAMDITADGFRGFEQLLTKVACENATMRAALARGAIYTYNLRDQADEAFTTSVRSCD